MPTSFAGLGNMERPPWQFVNLEDYIYVDAQYGTVNPQVDVLPSGILVSSQVSNEYSVLLSSERLNPITAIKHAGYPWYAGFALEKDGVLVGMTKTGAYVTCARINNSAPRTVYGITWPKKIPAFIYYNNSSQYYGQYSMTGQTRYSNGSYIPAHYPQNVQAPATANDTSPAIADPTTAPTCTPQTTGGGLPDGTYYVAYAYATRSNKTKTLSGKTLPSAEQTVVVSGGGGAGSIDVTIPALPSGAIGYIVYIGTTSGDLHAFGGGSVTGTHTIQATYYTLGLENKFFYRNYTSSYETVVGTFGDIATAPWITYQLSPAGYSANEILYWSPFFKRPHEVLSMKSFVSYENGFFADRLSLISNTWVGGAYNQSLESVEGDGTPVRYDYNVGDHVARNVPECMAYADIHSPRPHYSAPGGPGGIILRSCFDNSILWSMNFGELGKWSLADPADARVADFQFYDGALYAVFSSRKHRGIFRVPVIID